MKHLLILSYAGVTPMKMAMMTHIVAVAWSGNGTSFRVAENWDTISGAGGMRWLSRNTRNGGRVAMCAKPVAENK